ncbi:hypothetical protein ACFP2F_14590 [Hymenobacter artigasi]|uniref:Uncharacterized protein n=1 Tax=Hymenobacter artigasi TaxID=2719616 RepID=A0ABX1HKV7_9BACT|nr:hypothetical protein [Hymenobacter artigasi]NKI90845.1 hypothetical protein [Hymenobacter artigasi]
MASYAEAMGLVPDFRINYMLFSPEEGGRKTPHYQGIRWDFSYENETIGKPNQVFLIWPEFISDSSEILPENEAMPKHGLADMFIVNPAFRAFHAQHIKVGMRGYFREGSSKIALCEVVEIFALHRNPQS